MIDANVLNEKKAVMPAPVKIASVKVRATKQGYAGVVRHPGEVFEMPAGSKGSWFEPIEKLAAAKVKGTVLNDSDLA